MLPRLPAIRLSYSASLHIRYNYICTCVIINNTRNNAKLDKKKVCAELQLQKIRYERQLESVKQISNEKTNLIKSNFNEENYNNTAKIKD